MSGFEWVVVVFIGLAVLTFAFVVGGLVAGVAVYFWSRQASVAPPVRIRPPFVHNDQSEVETEKVFQELRDTISTLGQPPPPAGVYSNSEVA